VTLDVLEVTGIEVRCIVGVYPHERDQPQPLIVDLALHLDTSVAGEREQMSATVDYGRLAGEVRFLLESCRFRLLETAAEAIARYALLGPTGGGADHRAPRG
jgi:dihydroneopterin aldolase